MPGMYLCIYAYRVLLPLLLLLLAAVRHRVPDGKIVCWFIESGSSVFFLFTQTRFTFNVLLGSTVAFTASICLYYYTLYPRK